MPPCTNGNDTCRKSHPLFNLQIPFEPVSVKDTHLLKERRKIMKNTSMSSIPAYESSLRIYCTTEPLKSCGTCFG